MPLRAKLIIILFVCVGVGLYVRSRVAYNIHDEIRRRLLQAELGSAITVNFAAPLEKSVPTDDSISDMIAKLRSAMPEVRWDAADRLAQRGDPAAVDALIRAMRDPTGTLRVCVMAKALGHLKDPRALSALTEAAFDPANQDLRLCAIQSMGMIGDRRAVPKLIESLEARNMPLASADALARLGDERGVEPIIHAAADPDLKLWMVSALGELGSPEAIPFLKKLDNDPQELIRRRAPEARWKITQLSSADPTAALARVLSSDPAPARRMWAAFRIGERGDSRSVEALVLSLDDSDRDVRGRAVTSLIRLGQPTVHRLREILKQPEAPANLYAAAILGYLGKEDDIAALARFAESSDVQLAQTAQESVRLIKELKSKVPDPVAYRAAGLTMGR